MVPPMVAVPLGIEILPLSVVNRNLHFGRVAVVQAVAAAVILAAVEILRVIDIGIVLESSEITTP